MVLAITTVQNKDFLASNVLPGKHLSSRVEKVSSGHIVVRNVNLRVTAIESQASTKLRNGQFAGTGRDVQRIANRILAGIVGVPDDEKRRVRVVICQEWRDSQLGSVRVGRCTRVAGGSQQVIQRNLGKVSK